MNNNSYVAVRSMVMVQLDQLRKEQRAISKGDIESAVEATADMWASLRPDGAVDRMAMVRELEAAFNVYVGKSNALADDADHIRWLPERRDSVDWRLWSRYKRLIEASGLPPTAIESLDDVTDDILARLEDPLRPGAWDRRGLVAGQVQSGKTANYTGLIAKALDAGYKLVVVLAGIHNSLRSQTQSRIDEGILGFDTRKNRLFDEQESRLIGVGQLAGPFIHVHSFTSSAEQGDFSWSVAEKVGVAVGGNDPVVLVVKKNKSILTNLHGWATELRKEKDPVTNRSVVRDVPVLVIDDEADHASVDTNGPRKGSDEHDPTVINKLIRKFLNTFEQTAYVAYTATPFANIFIDPDADHKDAGFDLFPRSFIVNLPAPSNYIGPTRVFGLKEDLQANIEHVEALPIVRKVNDYTTWMPDGHKSDFVPLAKLPDSLKEAILSFLVAGAVRRFRGQGDKHNSMLIHVTRFTEVQRYVFTQVKDELEEIRNRIHYGEGANQSLRQQILKIFEGDAVPTHDAIARDPELADQVGPMPSFDVLMDHVGEVINKTQIRVINGKSADAFEYIDHPGGVSVIAIGGNKLSRGLTLEGLTVSYYLRSTRMYDTLMQMGRWFGYRPRYLDTCRLYTTEELERWYVAITSASEELLREFDYMVALGEKPKTFGLRVKQHPDGLLVTSPTKLRHAKKISISFAGTVSETIIFKRDLVSRQANLTSVGRLIRAVGQPQGEKVSGMGDAYVWPEVSPDAIIDFLRNYVAHPAAIKAQPKALRDYIMARISDSPSELNRWTLVIANRKGSGPVHSVGMLSVGLTKRAQYPPKGEVERYSIRRILSPPHERVGVLRQSPEWQKALDLTRDSWRQSPRKDKDEEEPNVPSGRALREVRDPNHGLMIIYLLDPAEAQLPDEAPFVGFALSFPSSENADPVEYQVNNIFWTQQFQGVEDPDLEAENEPQL